MILEPDVLVGIARLHKNPTEKYLVEIKERFDDAFNENNIHTYFDLYIGMNYICRIDNIPYDTGKLVEEVSNLISMTSYELEVLYSIKELEETEQGSKIGRYLHSIRKVIGE